MLPAGEGGEVPDTGLRQRRCRRMGWVGDPGPARLLAAWKTFRNLPERGPEPPAPACFRPHCAGPQLSASSNFVTPGEDNLKF